MRGEGPLAPELVAAEPVVPEPVAPHHRTSIPYGLDLAIEHPSFSGHFPLIWSCQRLEGLGWVSVKLNTVQLEVDIQVLTRRVFMYFRGRRSIVSGRHDLKLRNSI